jgi:hypothetical protein
MNDRGRLIGRILATQLVFMPTSSFGKDTTEINITLGRASTLIENASNGLGKLSKSRKSKSSLKWAEELQSRASDLCSFVQKELKKKHLDDKDFPLCSVE